VTRWVASAPGKVVLLGEYAVLEGAPALVQAVDRRCRVELTGCSARDCRVEVPQLGIPPVGFRLGEDGRPLWPGDLAPEFARTAALIDAVLEHTGERGGRIVPFRLRIDTGELFDGSPRHPLKLGLGSSAASAVAIDAALQAAFLGEPADESAERRVERLLVPGRAAQGNAGSGIDLAASLCGGTLAYRLDGERVEIRPVVLPEGIECCFIWAGEPASTGALLAAWQGLREASPREYGRILGEMQAVAAAGIDAVDHADAARMLACWSDYGEIMGKMNDVIAREVVTVEHRLAGALAQLLGGVYKPCGAGGGDLGLAASDDARFVARMRELCDKAGLATLPIRPGEQGVCVTRE
jgi:phosphomevalonate kinase